MELLFLGTGAGLPAKSRNVSSVALEMYNERKAVWLFDCGEATQHQILHTSLKPRKIEAIWITHVHGDHIFGLPGLLSSRSFLGGDSSVTIYGPKGVQAFVEVALQASETHVSYPIQFVEVEEGRVFEDEHVIVDALRLEHGVPSYAYRVQEKPRVGALDVDKLRSLGVRPGPDYGKLQRGESVVLPDGTVLLAADVVGPNRQGKTVVVAGDTRYFEPLFTFAHGADALVHEAT
ncbi:MAG: ribonuclease Z, partial [Bacilli bacterium]